MNKIRASKPTSPDVPAYPMRKRGSSRVVFADPKTGETWSGIGPCPRWLQTKLDLGDVPSSYLVPGAKLPPAFAEPNVARGSHRWVVFRCPTSGQTWSGIGYQPPWFRILLKEGVKPKDLLVDGEVLPDRFRPRKQPVRPAAKARPSVAKTSPARQKHIFRSPDGRHTWSGRGAQPGWFADYIAQKGHSVRDLLGPDATLPPRFKAPARATRARTDAVVAAPRTRRTQDR